MAQFNLGYAYFNGDGVSVDKVESRQWFRLAADQGHIEAISYLESLHE